MARAEDLSPGPSPKDGEGRRVRLRTARGTYVLSADGEPLRSESSVVVTLTLEHADGIERIAFRCAIADRGDRTGAILEMLAPWIERQFEQLREAALKSIRSEGKLLQVEFLPNDDPA